MVAEVVYDLVGQPIVGAIIQQRITVVSEASENRARATSGLVREHRRILQVVSKVLEQDREPPVPVQVPVPHSAITELSLIHI